MTLKNCHTMKIAEENKKKTNEIQQNELCFCEKWQ